VASTNICPLGIGQVFEDQDRSSRFSAQAVLQVFSAFVPSTSFCCFDILSTTVIVLCSWSSRLCHVSDAHGGCNLYPVVAFLFIAPSFSRPNSMFNSISVAVVFLQPFEPRHHFLSIGYRSSSSYVSTVSQLFFQFFTRSVWGSQSPLPSPSLLFVLFLSFILFRHNLDLSQRQSMYLIGRLDPCHPPRPSRPTECRSYKEFKLIRPTARRSLLRSRSARPPFMTS